MLDKKRREIKIRRDVVLIQLYNLINDLSLREDKEIDRLRGIHVEIDDATLDAYDWEDISLNQGFHIY